MGLKSIDIFRHLPQDIQDSTHGGANLAGALISIGTTFIMGMLLVTEISTFMEEKTQSVMKIQQAPLSDNKLQINIDLTLHAIPCHIVSLDVQDLMMTHVLDVGGALKKYRLSSNGVQISDTPLEQDHHNVDIEDLKRAKDAGESCNLAGYIQVNRVPGNFHISTHAYNQYVAMLGMHDLNLTHTINHLSFGPKYEVKRVQKKFKKHAGELTPLDGSKELYEAKAMTTYYLNIVPTTYRDRIGFSYPVNQFTVTKKTQYIQHHPALYFKFELSGVTVNYKQSSESIL